MHLSHPLSPLPPLLPLFSHLTTATTTTPSPPQTLNITAIVGHSNHSTFQCWSMNLTTSTDPGTSGASSGPLGPLENGTYTTLPPHFDGGLHNAPAAQYVVFLSGLAHITLPHSREEVWVRGGARGMIVAADTAEVAGEGHRTEYPGDEVTVAVQMPFRDGVVPVHEVVGEGACRDV
ncbi:hypothetical protein AJ79_09856 [Helicocarpus griseus UAMH5409]|uniref:Uncharacterized protein n=1 Tax=Helicocarpus griseus UAMH5409 TaxID=1447875 RepID=A0A2B7WGW4_9EURO|nr:hypothetical protein AJ79_09856 [Helicocarpus griseus UAMH5409]